MNTTKNTASLYEALKQKGKTSSGEHGAVEGGEQPIALDDVERVKVLSPGRLVFKRFFRNKLAVLGLFVLLLMFLFSFAGAMVYPYSQTEIFYKFDYLNTNYASAVERVENIIYPIPGGVEVSSTVANSFNSYIAGLEAEGAPEKTVAGADGAEYIVSKLGDRVYALSAAQMVRIGTYRPGGRVAVYNGILDTFEWTGEPLSDELKNAALLGIDENAEEFEFQGTSYQISGARNRYTITRADPEFSGLSPGEGFIAAIGDNPGGGSFEYNGRAYRATAADGDAYDIYESGAVSAALVASTYVFNAYDVSIEFSDEFKVGALLAIYGEDEFAVGGERYCVIETQDDLFIYSSGGDAVAELSAYSIRRYSGQDTLTIDFKDATRDVIEKMLAGNETSASFTYALHEIDMTGNYIYNEAGEPQYTDSEITVTRRYTGEYILTCEQVTYLIDIFAPPTGEHLFGTDGDGMDILARMMYGGRVSLMVGFVVVLLEIALGVIMGGISGFFSGWVDTLIMRVADIFYCVPSYPILIILGALFDKLKMDPYRRLIWMMVTLGILGWASVARLVRGQILSLREQEFMIAQEATGMKARRRIFRHLVPNVMPQLIVTATMGVGEVIIYESTLSFLGLGVKHPLATWGTMINAVTSSAESMIKYTYIWVPIGLLICLTVIAFNFVGDGLRDAFDPKMKR